VTQDTMTPGTFTDRRERLIPLPRRRADRFCPRPYLRRTWGEIDRGLRSVLVELATAKRPWPLLLWGGVGTGKTRALLALSDRINYARVWTVEDLIRDTLSRRPPWERDVPPRLAVLDEIGAPVSAKDFEYRCVKAFVDWREDQAAAYLTNLPPHSLGEAYDRRIASRLTCGTIFELTGPDRRLVGQTTQ